MVYLCLLLSAAVALAVFLSCLSQLMNLNQGLEDVRFPLTLFIMSELIINSKLATDEPRHFELQKYPLKENCMRKIAISTGIQTWDQ